MKKEVKISELFDCRVPYLSDFFKKFDYPWELLPHIKSLILDLLSNGIDGFNFFRPGILVGENVDISDGATLIAPAVLGHGTTVRPGAYIRGNVITGESCVLGNSSEFKNCILLDRVETPHYNYVGDSVLGNRAHMGAGSICSNLKSDKSSVIIHGDRDFQTGLRKVGGFLGDGADVGCSCVINPGTVIGKNTSVYPLTSLRGVYPPDSIIKDALTVVKRY